MARTARMEGQTLRWLNDTGSAVNADDLLIIGATAGVSLNDVADGTIGEIAIKGGWALPKATGEATAIAQGVLVYLDAVAGVVTTDDATGTNAKVGKTLTPAADGDARVVVDLNAA